MRAQFGRARLDQELAAGVRPDSDPLLRERAQILLSRESRLRMASGIDRARRQAERPARHTAQVPVRTQAVRDAAPALERLAYRMRGHLPISPQGAAKTNILLTDGSGPLYSPDGSDLKAAARSALAALEADSGQQRVMVRRVGNAGS
ncbi:MAG: hypothetical protein JSU06_13360 [Actinobacteria bacterium]|nr:hypothetical protein [Actinomycetota bacterium]